MYLNYYNYFDKEQIKLNSDSFYISEDGMNYYKRKATGQLDNENVGSGSGSSDSGSGSNAVEVSGEKKGASITVNKTKIKASKLR